MNTISHDQLYLLARRVGWVDVRWDNGRKNSYRFGKDSAMDIKVENRITLTYCYFNQDSQGREERSTEGGEEH